MSNEESDEVATSAGAVVLTRSERRLVEAAQSGTVFGPPGDEGANGDLVEVDGTFLSDLLIEGPPEGTLHHRGLHLRMVGISGELRLDLASIDVPISFIECKFSGPAYLANSRLKQLSFINCKFRKEYGISKEELEAENIEGFRRALKNGDGVDLRRARIEGDLTFDRTTAVSPGARPTLDAEGAQVTGDVRIAGHYNSTEIRLRQTKVEGDVIVAQSTFFGSPIGDESRPALDLSRANVGGNVSLSGIEATAAEIRLSGAKIGGDLLLRWASLVHVESEDALVATDLTVAGTASLWESKIVGGVRLGDASIGLLDDFQSGKPSPSPWPEIWYGTGFAFKGFSDRASVEVEKRLQWLDSEGDGLGTDPESASIRFRMKSGDLDLKKMGRQQLLSRREKRGSLQRKPLRRWRHLLEAPSEPFNPGLYTQLADVYDNLGQVAMSRRVLIRREQRRTLSLSRWRRLFHVMWGVMSAYGYQPWRVLWFLAGTIFIGWLVFSQAEMSVLVGLDAVAFHPLLYSVDVSLPIVDLRQSADYQPSGDAAQLWMIASIVIGWFCSIAFVAAVTGILRPDE